MADSQDPMCFNDENVRYGFVLRLWMTDTTEATVAVTTAAVVTRDITSLIVVQFEWSMKIVSPG